MKNNFDETFKENFQSAIVKDEEISTFKFNDLLFKVLRNNLLLKINKNTTVNVHEKSFGF